MYDIDHISDRLIANTGETIIIRPMELQILLILILAFIVLGPERMMDLAVKLGELMRKVRDMWDEVRLQSYMEEINRKIMEESKEVRVEDETEEDGKTQDIYTEEEEEIEDEHGTDGETRPPDDASDRTPERTQDKAS